MAKLERDTKRTALLCSSLFAAMQPAEIDEILGFASERRVRRGQTIFSRGDSGSSMMAVLRGRVRISSVSSDGKEVTLSSPRDAMRADGKRLRKRQLIVR